MYSQLAITDYLEPGIQVYQIVAVNFLGQHLVLSEVGPPNISEFYHAHLIIPFSSSSS